MATFRIHNDQENPATFANKKENTESYNGGQRKVLGVLNQLPLTNQNRTAKMPLLSNHANIMKNDESKPGKVAVKEKTIVPPVAQFEAFNVYEDEDKPDDNLNKRREGTFKPFTAPSVKTVQVQDENAIPKPSSELEQVASAIPRQPFHDKFKDEVSFDSPMSVAMENSALCMSISKNESVIVDDGDADTTTAQNDREMFFHVSEYRLDIYEYMREIEAKHRPNPRYMRKQPDINYSMRAILVDWLSEVCEEYAQQSETLHLAVSYVDRFLSYMSVVRGKLQLVGTAATFIAAKYEEVCPPEVRDFVYITDDTYNKREVLRMEHLILKVLSFDLSTPTALAFLSLYCITHQLSKKTFHLAQYIADLSLLDGETYLQFKPSITAASALATARHCLFCKRCNDEEAEIKQEKLPYDDCLEVAWPKPLEECSGYTVLDLEMCMKELARTHAHAQLQQHKAIPEKYESRKFDSVSIIEARPLYPVAKHQSLISTPKQQSEARPQANNSRTHTDVVIIS